MFFFCLSPFTTPGTFGHPRPPSLLLSPFWTTQHEYNTTSMGGPSGRDLNPADLRWCRKSVALPSTTLPSPLKDIHTHIHGPAEVPSLEKNPPPSVRFEPTSAGTATSEHCLRQPFGHRATYFKLFKC
jgi:hypothetical protein